MNSHLAIGATKQMITAGSSRVSVVCPVSADPGVAAAPLKRTS